jgi:hypothetical protein
MTLESSALKSWAKWLACQPDTLLACSPRVFHRRRSLFQPFHRNALVHRHVVALACADIDLPESLATSIKYPCALNAYLSWPPDLDAACLEHHLCGISDICSTAHKTCTCLSPMRQPAHHAGNRKQHGKEIQRKS